MHSSAVLTSYSISVTEKILGRLKSKENAHLDYEGGGSHSQKHSIEGIISGKQYESEMDSN